MATEKQDRFSERWHELALDVTLQVAPEATIGTHSMAQAESMEDTLDVDSAAFDKTIDEASLAASQSGEPQEPTMGTSLPRISLGGSKSGPAVAGKSGNSPDLELRRTLGEGGMGRVHEARQRSLRRHVAVKTLKDGASVESRNALLQEARITGFLEHPGIIPIHSLGLDDDGNPVLVMKRVQGVPWSELLDHEDHEAWEFWSSRHGKDRLLVHLEILSQVCDAVHFAHSQGIVHRDIKPENVMLGSFGEVYLVDWGLAIRDPSEAVGQLVGTPAFMAPEMAMGEEVDERSDVYLLGATLHQIITGTYLHRGKTLKELLRSATESARFAYDEEVPAELATLADLATRPAAGERPSSAELVRQAIANYLAHRNSIAVSDAARERLIKGDALHKAEGVSPEELAFGLGTLCAEARFGFEQALDAWPENEDARSGLRECLELLVEMHILKRDPHGASAQLALLDDPPKDLRIQVAALEVDVAKEKAERERFLRLRKDLDRRFGLSQRIWGFAVILVAVVVISLYFVLFSDITQMTNEDTVAIGAGFTVMTGVVLFRWRDSLLGNAFGRRISAITVVGFVAMTVHRLIAWQLGISVHQVFVIDLLIMAMVGAIGGLTIAGWILWMSPVGVAGAVIMAFTPESWGPSIFSITNALALVISGSIWMWGRPDKRRTAPASAEWKVG